MGVVLYGNRWEIWGQLVVGWMAFLVNSLTAVLIGARVGEAARVALLYFPHHILRRRGDAPAGRGAVPFSTLLISSAKLGLQRRAQCVQWNFFFTGTKNEFSPDYLHLLQLPLSQNK